MGANVIVTEIDPLKALEAVMDGFRVMPMAEAAKIGDIFCTVTGDLNVIDRHHFEVMKDGAIVSNSGHFNVEINIPALEEMSATAPGAPFVDQYVTSDGRQINLLGEGRLINLASAEGHPASVMDMSFANQALSAEYMLKNAEAIDKEIARSSRSKVYSVPNSWEEGYRPRNCGACLKLAAMGGRRSQAEDGDVLTPEQVAYLNSWQEGKPADFPQARVTSS
jgi:adenosylhomocysteinase